MSNSGLVDCTLLSPNKTSPRRDAIRKITIHHMAGDATVEACGRAFQGGREASANYGIGSDGRVGLYVDEADRSWASSSPANDHQAVTIEVANCGGAPDWPVSDEAYAKLIDLCVDICRRNGIPKLTYTGDKTGNLTMHSMFAATCCPGPYLKARFGEIAAAVNQRLEDAMLFKKKNTAAVAMKDISGHWAEKEIQRCVDAGLLKGDEYGFYRPGASMTRAELAVVMARLLDKLGK